MKECKMAVRFRWQGPDVIIETISGNYLYRYQRVRDCYHSGPDIVIVTETMSTVRIDSNGCRHFG